MPLWNSFLLAIGLGSDAFSVATGIGARGIELRQEIRLSFSFGLFQFLMPLLGFQLGRVLALSIHSVARIVAPGLIAAIGIHMILTSGRPNVTKAPSIDYTAGWSLLALSVATSIDAWIAGLSLGFFGTPILLPALVIGLVTFAMSFAGARLGRLTSAFLPRHAGLLGGLVLMGLAIKMLLE